MTNSKNAVHHFQNLRHKTDQTRLSCSQTCCGNAVSGFSNSLWSKMILQIEFLVCDAGENSNFILVSDDRPAEMSSRYFFLKLLRIVSEFLLQLKYNVFGSSYPIETEISRFEQSIQTDVYRFVDSWALFVIFAQSKGSRFFCMNSWLAQNSARWDLNNVKGSPRNYNQKCDVCCVNFGNLYILFSRTVLGCHRAHRLKESK